MIDRDYSVMTDRTVMLVIGDRINYYLDDGNSSNTIYSEMMKTKLLFAAKVSVRVAALASYASLRWQLL